MARAKKRNASTVSEPEPDDEVRKKTGRTHSKPLVVAYRTQGDESAEVHVSLISPRQSTSQTYSTGGLYQGLGIFQDNGFEFSGILREDHPEWVDRWLTKYGEENDDVYEVIAWVKIKAFPIPELQ